MASFRIDFSHNFEGKKRGEFWGQSLMVTFLRNYMITFFDTGFDTDLVDLIYNLKQITKVWNFCQ